MIKDHLMICEGGPTDSETLTSTFHNYGINMRYLGEVLIRFRKECELKDVKFKYVVFILEKEIFVRSLKHVLIELMQESDLESSVAVIAHVFNCIFSSQIML